MASEGGLNFEINFTFAVSFLSSITHYAELIIRKASHITSTKPVIGAGPQG